ncbi:bifunctional 4-hydroxy-2-oxoglutarate aldolase/2-dehydro-3-deoxy-phosphogluconate aldolase [Eubacterium xylanophilum]|uniref:bifunctional 4-hydroxy-2-oxoglutarate aldolase/2-dehydro-3-deoxy-phosphogluconate aldolase n=1 Tax=Eubacterium xylanophilum TaxID=39497 RepID=UPI00047DEE55|nr:bifunctional 4-hydroxy-2-oxoglutarate aldolase/2-dehydro-3-deoxy-phosphogluconate aldolase [Eubacterium xylanophilum]
MNETLVKLSKIGIVPVVALNKIEDARPLAEALCAGGLPCAEVTFRTACAEEAIRIMSQEFPQMFVGAGTVLTTEQVDRAVNAGAKFIVSPGLNPEVVKYCVDKGIPVTPGCANPSDIEQAIALGLDVVKVFPAEAIGGLKLIKSMAAPYVNMKFMPTGGINAGNLNEYLAYDRIIACGGSWMVSSALVDAGKFDEITELTKEAVKNMLGFRIKHIGINSENEAAATTTANAFCNIFGFAKDERPKSFFCGEGIEVMKMQGRGKMGHIAVGCNSVERAVYHLSEQGIEFDMDSAEYNEKGVLTFIYFKESFGGFDVHLTLN